MNRTTLALVLISILSVVAAMAQDNPPNNYRSKDNKYYWKNRPPYEGYWQQDTYYNIKVSLDDKTDILSGDETLTYWNN